MKRLVSLLSYVLSDQEENMEPEKDENAIKIEQKDENEEVDRDEIEAKLKKLQEEAAKQVNDAVTQATAASQSLTKISETVLNALESLTTVQHSLKIKQDDMMQMINSHKRANLDMIEEQATKKRRITEEATEKLTSLQQRMAEEAKKAEDIIKLNVGGQMFTTSKATLLSQPDTYFSGMLGNGQWKPQPDGSYFIDRDPERFKVVLEFLRTNILGIQDLTPQQRQLLKRDMDFFQISVPKRADSQILEDHEDMEKTLVSWLPDKQKIGPLLFRASTEAEFSARRFHEVCDGQAPLLIVAQTRCGDICGGYAASSFSSALPQATSTVERSASEKSFIFTLVNQYNTPPTQFLPQKPDMAQASARDWGPCFGPTNPDLLFMSSTRPSCGLTSFPQAYKDTTGRGQAIFGRNKVANSYFQLAVLEVFKITE